MKASHEAFSHGTIFPSSGLLGERGVLFVIYLNYLVVCYLFKISSKCSVNLHGWNENGSQSFKRVKGRVPYHW